MTKEEIEEIPGKIAANMLTYEKAAWMLLTDIYLRPFHYFGEIVDEDTKSDFVTDLHPKLIKMIKRHNPAICSFYLFFRVYISNSFLTTKKLKSMNNYNKSILNENSSEFYQRAVERYNRIEKKDVLEFGDQEPEYKGITKKTHLYNSMKLKNARHIKSKVSLLWPGKTTAQKKVTIIALKACYYLQDSQIDSVCKFCGYEKKVFEEKIRVLCNDLGQISKSRERFLEKRDKSYYFHRKYSIILSSLEPASPLFDSIKEKYKIHTKIWKEKNRMLNKNRFRICPTNKAVAEAIGMSERQVSNYIAEIKKDYNEADFYF